MGVFLIIGGSSDIGFATSKKLIANGHQIHLTSRKEENIIELAKQLNASYSIIEASNFEEVSQTFLEMKNKFGNIDGVVNCAGSMLLKSAHLTTQSDYESIIKAHLTTAFAVVHAAGKHMIEKGGAVVLISSAAALHGLANHEAIAAAKAGIIGLARSASATYANYHLRFNVVAPGLIQTKLTSSLTQHQVTQKISENMHALGRLGTVEDVASAIVFFLQPENNWITGQVLAVDGGLSSIMPKIKF